MELPDAPGCLSSRLTTFDFDGFENLEHEVKFVKYILKEARALNTMTIKIPAELSKEDVFHTLSMFPGLSTTCLITTSFEGMLQIFYLYNVTSLCGKVTLLFCGCYLGEIVL